MEKDPRLRCAYASEAFHETSEKFRSEKTDTRSGCRVCGVYYYINSKRGFINYMRVVNSDSCKLNDKVSG